MEHGPPYGSEIILLTDDEPQVRKTTAQVLKKFGYEVIQAGSAEEALQLAAAWEFDLLLMDVVLPGMTGMSLAHKIVDQKPGTRVLFYSAYASPEILDSQFIGGPGISFIQKPFKAIDMAWAVRRLLDEPVPGVPEEDTVAGGSESILVMDDDAQIRRFMVKALERLGYHILEARDLDLAVTMALKSRVDLLITDLGQPKMTGPAVAKALLATKPELRVLFVSETEPAAESLEPDQPTVLKKPFSSVDLGRVVREVLDRPLPQ